MTSDSDDVADTANRKPKGSVDPPSSTKRDHEPDPVSARDDAGVATGEQQARANRDSDPPA
jgi:hypothetical protein